MADSHGVLHLTEACRSLLRGEESIQLRQDKRKHESLSKRKDPQQNLDADGTWVVECAT